MQCINACRGQLILTGSSPIKPFSAARDLGVFIDSVLLQTHVKRTVSRCLNTLHQLRNIRRQVPSAVFQSLVVALVLSFDVPPRKAAETPVGFLQTNLLCRRSTSLPSANGLFQFRRQLLEQSSIRRDSYFVVSGNQRIIGRL